MVFVQKIVDSMKNVSDFTADDNYDDNNNQGDDDDDDDDTILGVFPRWIQINAL